MCLWKISRRFVLCDKGTPQFPGVGNFGSNSEVSVAGNSILTSLLSSQLLALPVRDRLDFMTRLHQLKEDPISPDVTEHPNTDHGVSIDRTILWRAILSRPPPPCPKRLPQPKAGESSQTDESPRQRERRNVHSRGHHNHHHGQLMRVGCVLGYLPGAKPQSPPLPAGRPKPARRLPHQPKQST
ncbi:hypothetical protein F2P79_009686 [Pimephales promelas]|nr:hypothetical protein F2P79_009686 [Pimephales promelas]